MTHTTLDHSQAPVFEELGAKRDSTFVFKYFGLHGLGAIARMILSAANASFTNVIPTDWASEKSQAPFGVIPILTETSSDGSKTIQIAESEAIERYLAKKFGFAGDNVFEEVMVDTYSSNTKALMNQFSAKCFSVKDPELKKEGKAKLIAENIPTWIQYHERYLTQEGANGHYVGNKLTLADIKTVLAINMVQGISGEDLISQEKTPALWKVKSTFDSIPSVAAVMATEEYKSLSDRNFSILGYH
ncbi:Glutathione S-transferase S1 [Dissophora globulifera]|nr:Glutathione S-transferase S1 [Dissophora globulifera]